MSKRYEIEISSSNMVKVTCDTLEEVKEILRKSIGAKVSVLDNEGQEGYKVIYEGYLDDIVRNIDSQEEF
jgi:hypothetical protein